MLIDGPAQARARFLFAHGAGAPMDTPFMTSIAEGLAASGLRVIRFEFPYMARRRDDGKRRGPDRMPVLLESWRAVLADAGDSVTIERLAGLAAARDTFAAMAGGSVDPARGIVIEP